MNNRTSVSSVRSRLNKCLQHEYRAHVVTDLIIPKINFRIQDLCESRGGRPGLSVLMSLTVSVDVKQHFNHPLKTQPR